jgi:ArsR family transcriptional regulator, arsenate/arsenite/antimonite-responsive transcriptional repressor
MSLVQIYGCLCDQTRLRILNLLNSGPLCVCHVQEVLGEPQVKVSKHLSYLKRNGLVTATRQGSWMIYSLPARPSAALKRNLACLQDCAQEEPLFGRDAEKCRQLRSSLDACSPVCAPKSVRVSARR